MRILILSFTWSEHVYLWHQTLIKCCRGVRVPLFNCLLFFFFPKYPCALIPSIFCHFTPNSHYFSLFLSILLFFFKCPLTLMILPYLTFWTALSQLKIRVKLAKLHWPFNCTASQIREILMPTYPPSQLPSSCLVPTFYVLPRIMNYLYKIQVENKTLSINKMSPQSLL